MDEGEKAPLLVVEIKDIPYVFESNGPLEFEQYSEIRSIAEDPAIYEMNANCINPGVLAYQFIRQTARQTGIHLSMCQTWPKLSLNLRKE